MSKEARVDIRLTEIAAGIHQLTTYLPEMDFSLNQFVIDADEPLLFHTGMRWMFPSVSATVSRVCRPIACGGSRSATSRPTSADR